MSAAVLIVIAIAGVIVILSQSAQCGGCVTPETPQKFQLDLGADFMNKVQEICAGFGFDADWLMACIQFESGFDPARRHKNLDGSLGAAGLIQFTRSGLSSFGSTLTEDQVAQLSRIDQLDLVQAYFKANGGNRVQSLPDCYMVIFAPAAVGKSDNTVLYSQLATPLAYSENIGLDPQRVGSITKSMASAPVSKILSRQGTYFLPLSCCTNSDPSQNCGGQ